MKRLRHILAATFLLLGLVYLFTQHDLISISAEPVPLHTSILTNAEQTHDFSKQESSHLTGVLTEGGLLQDVPASGIPAVVPVPNEISTPATESSGEAPPSLIDFDFQKDLSLDLPVDIFNNLRLYAAHNHDTNVPESYAYATFFASHNPSIEDPYYLAIHSLIYRILWSPRSKTSKYPFVVFVAEFVPQEQRDLLAGAGAIVRELAPLPWNPTEPGVQDRWKDLFAKLNMWNEVLFSRILFLDADAFPIANIDDMFELKELRSCIESKMQLDDFLPGGDPVCEPYIFAGVPTDRHSIFDANINVGSMVFTPNARQHQRLLQNYLKFDKYDVKMAEQAFLNWQFGINSAYPPDMLGREYGAFFPGEKGEMGMKVVHEKIWAAHSGYWKDEWDNTWKEMLQFYRSEEFSAARRGDGAIMV
ncbi:hypothetical protein B5807_04572 [Epicoccum nigrum]|jgi:alpha-N-acetylglucosamine transferase|uniref:Glycosyltransferase family 8 protein n=1 Tax=Epicoccum nigrum TaxID=105696 RepID=A0A1Y2M3Z7_EPING|nr:hypothetical protein B5807_04572 [Epicoccum nigrum]